MMKKALYLFVALTAFANAGLLYFTQGDWFGALGWFLVGGYQIAHALEE